MKGEKRGKYGRKKCFLFLYFLFGKGEMKGEKRGKYGRKREKFHSD